jgi:transposase
MSFIGIDLSDKDFHACMTDGSGNKVSASSFDFNDDGFYSLIQWFRNHEISSDNCMIGLENPRSRLVDFLNQRKYTILPVNPNATAKYRESRSPSGVKSDPGDAHLIADYIREHEKALRPIRIPDEKIRELMLLLEDRDRLVNQKVRLSNQLTHTLKDYFPQALDAFGNIDNKCTLEFLQRVDTFQQVKSLSSEQIQQLLKDCRCYQKKSKSRFIRAMKQRASHVSPEIVRTKTTLKNALVSHLVLTIQHIEQYDKLIQELMSRIPNGDIFASLPGADHLLGAKMLVLYASKDFSNANEAQALYGTAPCTASSGKYRSVKFRKGCNKFGRNTFQQFAWNSIKTSQWARKHYNIKMNQGKGYNHAVRCIANLWVKVTFAMWKHKTPYDENKHMASVAVHIINQPDYVLRD